MLRVKLQLVSSVDFLFEEKVKHDFEFKMFYFQGIRCSICLSIFFERIFMPLKWQNLVFYGPILT